MFKNDTQKFGYAGLILVLSGLIGAIIAGVLLDKTKAFKYDFIVSSLVFSLFLCFTSWEKNVFIILEFANAFSLGMTTF